MRIHPGKFTKKGPVEKGKTSNIYIYKHIQTINFFGVSSCKFSGVYFFQ